MQASSDGTKPFGRRKEIIFRITLSTLEWTRDGRCSEDWQCALLDTRREKALVLQAPYELGIATRLAALSKLPN
ncbi:hypothetical protein MTO96_017059 [Rhipicephalus appendiculatus]